MNTQTGIAKNRMRLPPEDVSQIPQQLEAFDSSWSIQEGIIAVKARGGINMTSRKLVPPPKPDGL
jgi:sensor histidine kinase regulating citrate/malate metabolism